MNIFSSFVSKALLCCVLFTSSQSYSIVEGGCTDHGTIVVTSVAVKVLVGFLRSLASVTTTVSN